MKSAFLSALFANALYIGRVVLACWVVLSEMFLYVPVKSFSIKCGIVSWVERMKRSPQGPALFKTQEYCIFWTHQPSRKLTQAPIVPDRYRPNKTSGHRSQKNETPFLPGPAPIIINDNHTTNYDVYSTGSENPVASFSCSSGQPRFKSQHDSGYTVPTGPMRRSVFPAHFRFCIQGVKTDFLHPYMTNSLFAAPCMNLLSLGMQSNAEKKRI